MGEHPLTTALRALIDEHGLDLVYGTLREEWADGFCPNCGCPWRPGEKHTYAGLGHCALGQYAS